MENLQIMVWQGTTLGESTPEELEKFIKDELGCEVKYLENVETNPDIDKNGNTVPNTGGRSDMFISVNPNQPNYSSFCVKRLQMGMRWWEDVVSYNDGAHLYPKEILDKYPIQW